MQTRGWKTAGSKEQQEHAYDNAGESQSPLQHEHDNDQSSQQQQVTSSHSQLQLNILVDCQLVCGDAKEYN